MGHCRDCKYFKVDKDRPPYGDCHRWNIGYGYASAVPFEMPLNEVVVEDDEGWGMLMGPEFGCNLYEPKD